MCRTVNTLTVLLTLCLVNIPRTLAVRVVRNLKGTATYGTETFRLVNDRLARETKSSGIVDCAGHCGRESGCSGLNYGQDKRILIFADYSSDSQDVIAREGYTYYRIEDVQTCDTTSCATMGSFVTQSQQITTTKVSTATKQSSPVSSQVPPSTSTMASSETVKPNVATDVTTTTLDPSEKVKPNVTTDVTTTTLDASETIKPNVTTDVTTTTTTLKEGFTMVTFTIILTTVPTTFKTTPLPILPELQAETTSISTEQNTKASTVNQVSTIITIVSSPQDYTSAQSICESNGGNLFMPKSTIMQQSIEMVLQSHYPQASNPDKYFWIGANDQTTHNVFHFVDGTVVSEFFWGSGYVEDGVKSCVTVDSSYSYKWSEKSCDQALSFVCDLPAAPTPEVQTVQVTFYTVVDQTGTYSGSAQVCNATGGILVLPKTELEQIALEQTINATSSTRNQELIWIGVNDNNVANSYNFEDGTAVSNFFWGAGAQHVSDGIPSCVAVDRSYDFKWVEKPCGNDYPFFCQKVSS
ncbi:uncharacterized protein LOC143247673 [Tachypleus tridentatus]|uniref:uncharacterized protein LOC143247673 n=1 Tax=Tachypleus tridentatus TaxID=6853 RepID=UPI003FD0439E